MTDTEYDVMIAGGGAIGLAAAYQCAKAGKRTLVLESKNFFNQSGSSGDLMRMFRVLYSEPELTALAYDALQSWRDLENAGRDTSGDGTTPQLLWMTGQLNFGHKDYKAGTQGDLMEPLNNLKELGIHRYKMLTRHDVEEKYRLKDTTKYIREESKFLAYESPDCGVINVPETLRVLYRCAKRAGADLRQHTTIDRISPPGEEESSFLIKGRDVSGAEVEFGGKKLVLAGGAYTNDLLQGLGLKLDYRIWELGIEYYTTDPKGPPAHFPGMWVQFAKNSEGTPSNLYYGFPVVPWGPPNTLRIGWEDATVNDLTLDELKKRRSKNDGLVAAKTDVGYSTTFVRDHCRGVDGYPASTSVCLHTNLDDHMSVLGVLPTRIGDETEAAWRKDVVLATGGWAFKFLPVFGEIIAELVHKGKTKRAEQIRRMRPDRADNKYLHKI